MLNDDEFLIQTRIIAYCENLIGPIAYFTVLLWLLIFVMKK